MAIDGRKLGKIAYEKYAADADWLTFDGRQMPAWDDLGINVQRHWFAAAWAVVEELELEKNRS